MKKLAPAVLLAMPLTFIGGAAFAAETPAPETTDSSVVTTAEVEASAETDVVEAGEDNTTKSTEESAEDSESSYITLSFFDTKTGDKITFDKGKSPTLYVEQDGANSQVVIKDADNNGVFGDEDENKIVSSTDLKVIVTLADDSSGKLVSYATGDADKTPVLEDALSLSQDKLAGGENEIRVFLETPEETGDQEDGQDTAPAPVSSTDLNDANPVRDDASEVKQDGSAIEETPAEEKTPAAKEIPALEEDSAAQDASTVEEVAVEEVAPDPQDTPMVAAAAMAAPQQLPENMGAVVPNAVDEEDEGTADEDYGLQIENDNASGAITDPIDRSKEAASNLEGKNISIEENQANLDAAAPGEADGIADGDDIPVEETDDVSDEVASDDSTSEDDGDILADSVLSDAMADTGATPGLLAAGGFFAALGTLGLAFRGKKFQEAKKSSTTAS